MVLEEGCLVSAQQKLSKCPFCGPCYVSFLEKDALQWYFCPLDVVTVLRNLVYGTSADVKSLCYLKG